MATLGAAQLNYHHPVRSLVIDGTPPSVLARDFDAAAAQGCTAWLDPGTVPVIDFAHPGICTDPQPT